MRQMIAMAPAEIAGDDRVIVDEMPRRADVVVVGAGVVGAACTAEFARAGLDVCVLDRLGPAAGASSAGEGNLLVSDKVPGPELEFALHSLALWQRFAEQSEVPLEFETKGGLVVAAGEASFAALSQLVPEQERLGVRTEAVAGDDLTGVEPMLASGLRGGVRYPQDCQLQPMLAVRALLTDAARSGASVVAGAELLGVTRDRGGHVEGVQTSRGAISTSQVVLATGAWSGSLARGFGSRVDVRPRRGHIVVTEPLPPLVRHKVYEASYVDTVESDDAALLSAAVVEGTKSGPILLGSSRELVGWDQNLSMAALRMIARRATALFPFLRDVRAIRAYLGFRPASPDHLPIIGGDPDVPGLWHATGHEGAGVGLAPGTAELLRALIVGAPPPVDPAPFDPGRPAVRTSTADIHEGD
jgi:glycine/D-amino acid oxidase-like deaminating enzyme